MDFLKILKEGVRMKVKKIFFIVIAAIALSACGQSEDTKEPEENPQEKEDVGNKENVKAVVDAISDEDVRYKMWLDDEANVLVVGTNVGYFSGNDDNSYGFDDPDNIGTSIYAYADEKGLNQEQTDAIASLLYPENPVDEDGTKLKNVGEYYPDDYKDGEFQYQGADLDYVTLSNVETEESMAGEEITADVTAHLHLADGTEESRTFQSSVEPETGDTELDEEEVEEALSADVMNEEITTEDRFIYVDE